MMWVDFPREDKSSPEGTLLGQSSERLFESIEEDTVLFCGNFRHRKYKECFTFGNTRNANTSVTIKATVTKTKINVIRQTAPLYKSDKIKHKLRQLFFESGAVQEQLLHYMEMAEM